MDAREEHIEKLFGEMKARVQSIGALARVTVEAKDGKPLEDHNKETIASIVGVAESVIDVAREAARKGTHPLDIIVGLATAASVVNKGLQQAGKGPV